MNKKKNLTTEETFALALQNHNKNNLQVVENTAEDLQGATSEMIERIVNNNRNFKSEDIQHKFKQTIENVLFTQTKRKITAFADLSLNFLKKNIQLLQ